MWQALFRNFLYRAATRAASAAANERRAAPDSAGVDSGEPAAPPPCAAGIVFALGIEAGGLVDRMSGVLRTAGEGFVAREGGLDGRRLAIVESGIGMQAAARGAEALITGHRPAWVLSAGFAGGLREEVRAGDIIMATQVVDLAGRRLEIEIGVSPAALAGCPGLRLGRLLTAERVIADPSEKRRLGEATGALAVDMETFAVADVCRRERVRFLSVRVITDEVGQALPRDIDHLARQRSLPGRLGAAAGAIVRRPGSVKDMWKLKETAIAASDRLARFLVGVVPQLQ